MIQRAWTTCPRLFNCLEISLKLGIKSYPMSYIKTKQDKSTLGKALKVS